MDHPILQLKVPVLKAPMKRAALFRAHKVGIGYVLVSIHLRMMTWAEGTNIGPERGAGHRERLAQTLEQVCSTVYK